MDSESFDNLSRICDVFTILRPTLLLYGIQIAPVLVGVFQRIRINKIYIHILDFPSGSVVKNLPATQETQI